MSFGSVAKFQNPTPNIQKIFKFQDLKNPNRALAAWSSKLIWNLDVGF